MVPAELQDPHPAIAKAAEAFATKIAALSRAREEWQSRRVRRPGERWQPELMSFVSEGLHSFNRSGQVIDLLVVPLRVSSLTADRALRIWDALIKACALRALKLAPDGLLTAGGFQEKIPLRITERVTPNAGERKPSSAIAPHPAHTSKWPTGELRIMIGEGFTNKLVDRPNEPLETQLNSVLSKAYRQIVADKAYAERWREEAKVRAAEKLRSEEARLLHEEQVRLIAEERRRQKGLAEESESWVQSANISAYVANVIAAATAAGEPLSADLQRWANWAITVAEVLDPTKKRIGSQ